MLIQVRGSGGNTVVPVGGGEMQKRILCEGDRRKTGAVYGS